MKVVDALRAAAKLLEQTSDSARLDAEVLMAHALNTTRSQMLLRALLDGIEAPAEFSELVRRRAGHEPVAYIVGGQEFYGREFRVTRDVLIPRADSECVVAAALEARPDARRVLDCGVGSGALLATCLLEIPEAEGIGIDCSPAALAVAEGNARRLGIGQRRGRFLHRDWTQPDWARGLGRFDLIIANPPYVEEDADLAPSVRGFEPASALFAGLDGLADYRLLIPHLPALLEENGRVVLEIGATQAEAVRDIAKSAGFSASLRQDLGGRPRALILRLGLGNA